MRANIIIKILIEKYEQDYSEIKPIHIYFVSNYSFVSCTNIKTHINDITVWYSRILVKTELSVSLGFKSFALVFY